MVGLLIAVVYTSLETRDSEHHSRGTGSRKPPANHGYVADCSTKGEFYTDGVSFNLCAIGTTIPTISLKFISSELPVPHLTTSHVYSVLCYLCYRSRMSFKDYRHILALSQYLFTRQCYTPIAFSIT